jgi:hypothetical protein
LFVWFAKKVTKAFDLLCIWGCFFKVLMAWNEYGYYIESFLETYIVDASW